MSVGPLVDVAIGLMLVYLLLGLITTAFQEIVASFFKLRGKMPRDAMQNLLSDSACGTALFDKVFCHPMIAGTAADDYPSYVPSRNFALAVIDTLCDGSQAPVFTQVEQEIGKMQDGLVKRALQSLVHHAGGDVDVLRADLATWYDDAMDRLSGVYKRQSQAIAIGCGIFFAIVLNVDSIRIAETLWTNDALRAQVATAAPGIVQAHAGHPNTGDQAQFNDSMTQLLTLNLPIGWIANPPPAVSNTPKCAKAASSAKCPMPKAPAASKATPPNILSRAWDVVAAYLPHPGLSGVVLTLLGWAMTALAVSLGAPFWFDTLQQILNLRGTGPKPDTAAVAASDK